MENLPECPECGSNAIVKDGKIHIGKQNHRCRQCSLASNDFLSALKQVFPRKRHQIVGKETGKTSLIERFNYTLRQRISHLVRKTLSFSQKLENHIGAI